jgi:hypothetical protein
VALAARSIPASFDDFVVVTGTGNARDLAGFSPSNCTEKEKTGLPDLPIRGPRKIAK